MFASDICWWQSVTVSLTYWNWQLSVGDCQACMLELAAVSQEAGTGINSQGDLIISTFTCQLELNTKYVSSSWRIVSSRGSAGIWLLTVASSSRSAEISAPDCDQQKFISGYVSSWVWPAAVDQQRCQLLTVTSSSGSAECQLLTVTSSSGLAALSAPDCDRQQWISSDIVSWNLLKSAHFSEVLPSLGSPCQHECQLCQLSSNRPSTLNPLPSSV